MAHYARVNSDNIVTYVTPIPNEMITDENGVEHEEWALDHLYSTIPSSVGDRWIQASYSSSFRKNFPGIGYIWREDLDAFIGPKQFDSWIFDEENYRYTAPKPYPEEYEGGPKYRWDEELLNWKPFYDYHA